MLTRRLWAAVGATGVFATAACHSIRPVQPTQLVSGAFTAVRVTAADRSTVILHAPHLNGDTLAGFVDGEYREMLLSQTEAITARTRAPGRTLALGLVVGTSTLATLIYFANRSYVGDGQTCYAGRDGIIVPCCAGKSTITC
jgi:hypothetical protein